MSTKSVFIIVLSVMLTIFLMSNTDAVNFNFIVTTIPVSKLAVIGICMVIGFILGYIVGKPKMTHSSYDNEFKENTDEKSKNTLSDEDRDYIS